MQRCLQYVASAKEAKGTKPSPHSCARFPIVEANILGLVGDFAEQG